MMSVLSYLVIGGVALVLLIIIAIALVCTDSSKNRQIESYINQNGTDYKKSYFDGTTLQLIGLKLLVYFINFITLGLAYPWTMCMKERWEAKHTVINGRRLLFTGKGTQLFGKYILWIFLTIITLGIYSIWFGLSMKKWRTKHTVYADDRNRVAGKFTGGALGWFANHLLLYMITLFSLGILYAWGKKHLVKWKTTHTELGGSPLVFTGTGIQLFGKYLVLGILLIPTLGIYSLFFPVKYRKWVVSHTDALSSTTYIKSMSRAHESAANKDYAKFHLAGNDAELNIIRSGISGNESTEQLEEMASDDDPYVLYELASKLKSDNNKYEGRALELLKASADANYHRAMVEYAPYANDANEYLKYLDGSAKGGNSTAPWLLKQYYERMAYAQRQQGNGESLNTLKTAAYWFKIALEQENTEAVQSKAGYEEMVDTIALWQCDVSRPVTKNSGAVLGLVLGIIALIILVGGGLLMFGRMTMLYSEKMPAMSVGENTLVQNPDGVYEVEEDNEAEADNEYTVTSIPDVSNWTEEEALNELEIAGLIVDVVYEETGDYAEGTVIYTVPGAGEAVNAGDTVTVYVAKATVMPELDEAAAWELVERAHDSVFLPYYFYHDGIVDESDIYPVAVFPDEPSSTVDYPSVQGIDTVDDLVNSLLRHFTQNYIQSNFINTEYKKWIEAEGTLYFEPNWGMGFYEMWRESLTIEKIEEGKYMLSARGGIPEDYIDDPSYTPTYYHVIYENGGYKVDNITY